MLEQRHSAERLGLELAALQIEHELQANLIVRLADALYATPNERRLMDVLQAWQTDVAVFAAGLSD